jgi:predicted amidohydrolase
VASYERNYAQSAVLSPSDQVFPTDATIIESEADVETVIHAELELLRLASRRKSASVQPIQDRREDLYQLQPLRLVEIIKVL